MVRLYKGLQRSFGRRGAIVLAIFLSIALHAILLIYIDKSAILFLNSSSSAPSDSLRVTLASVREPTNVQESAELLSEVHSAIKQEYNTKAYSVSTPSVSDTTLFYEVVASQESVGGMPNRYYSADALSKMPIPLTSLSDILESTEKPSFHGVVSIRLWINTFGNLDRTEIISNDVPAEIGKSTADAFGKMHFIPGEINGMAVMSWVDVSVTYGNPFVLDGNRR